MLVDWLIAILIMSALIAFILVAWKYGNKRIERFPQGGPVIEEMPERYDEIAGAQWWQWDALRFVAYLVRVTRDLFGRNRSN